MRQKIQYSNFETIFLLLISLLCIKQIQSSYSYPVWKYPRNITLQASTERIIIVNNDIVAISKTKGVFQIYDAKTYSLKQQLNYTKILNPISVIDVDIIDNRYFYLLLSNHSINIYNIQSNNNFINTITVDKIYSVIKLTKYQIILYEDSRKEIRRIAKIGEKVIQNKSFSNLNFIRKIKLCQINNTHYYISLSSGDCYHQILYCQKDLNCIPHIYNDSCSGTPSSRTQPDFSFDCKYFIQIWKNKIPIIINLETKTTIQYSNSKTVNLSQRIYFLDESNLNYGQIALFQLFQFRVQNIISINSQPVLNIQLSENVFSYNKFNRLAVYQEQSNVRFAVLQCQNLYIFNEKLGICQNCPQNCNSCVYDQNSSKVVCSLCDSGYVKDGSGCKIFAPGQDEKNYEGVTRKMIQEFIDNTFQNTAVTPISSTIIIFQILPVSFLFMRFINFWSICSFYLFVPFDLPESLKIVLFSISQIINASIFNFFGIDFKIQMNLQQKFSKQLHQKFGLTSDFLNSNLQNFSILLFSYFIVFIIYLINKNLSKDNFIKSKSLNIGYSSVMLTQYASIMSSFYFVLITIKHQAYQLNTMQKFNQILRLSFFIFSTLTPFFVMISVQKKTKKIKKEETLQKLQNFYECACNSFIPFMAILGNLPLFLMFNLIFFIFTTYLAFHSQDFRINRIILSSYLIFFHIGFTLLTILNKQTYPQIYDIIIFSMKIILFLGAVHEGLTLVFGLIYDIFQIKYKLFKFFTNSNEIQKNESNTSLKNKLNKQKIINKIGEKIGELKKVTPITQNNYNPFREQKYTKSFYISKIKDQNKPQGSLNKIKFQKSEKFIKFKNNKIKKMNNIKKTMEDKLNKQHVNYNFIYKNGSLKRIS